MHACNATKQRGATSHLQQDTSASEIDSVQKQGRVNVGECSCRHGDNAPVENSGGGMQNQCATPTAHILTTLIQSAPPKTCTRVGQTIRATTRLSKCGCASSGRLSVTLRAWQCLAVHRTVKPWGWMVCHAHPLHPTKEEAPGGTMAANARVLWNRVRRRGPMKPGVRSRGWSGDLACPSAAYRYC